MIFNTLPDLDQLCDIFARFRVWQKARCELNTTVENIQLQICESVRKKKKRMQYAMLYLI